MNETNPTSNSFVIGVAETAEEKKAVFRFRYHIYIEEMHLKLETADHRQKVVTDDLDNKAVLLYASINGQIVATQRVTIDSIAGFPSDLRHLLSLEAFGRYSNGQTQSPVAYTSKLMVANAYRNSPLLHLLTAKGYEIYLKYAVSFNFGVCNYHLLRLYEQFGCRRYKSGFTAPGYDGVLMPFVLLVNDLQHLREVRSPFYRLAKKKTTQDDLVVKWFALEFPDAMQMINSQLTDQEELWSYLTARLNGPPGKKIAILQNLDEAEAKRFLADCGLVLRCQPGEPITAENADCHTLKILVSGTLLRKTIAGFLPSRIRPGECVGTVGLLAPQPYREELYAGTNVEMLILSRLSFDRFQIAHHDTALKITENLNMLARACSAIG